MQLRQFLKQLYSRRETTQLTPTLATEVLDAYAKLFASTHGDVVLDDLLLFFGGFEKRDAKDAFQAGVLEGERRVISHIIGRVTSQKQRQQAKAIYDRNTANSG